MEYLIVCLAALLASGLTLFSGFGLGTLLMPVIAIFFPVELAIAMTAVVHLTNNIFKIGLLGRKANPAILLRFGIPAVIAAFLGAALLAWLGHAEPLMQYQAMGRELQVLPIKLVVGLLIIGFVTLELAPGFSKLALDAKYLPLGGLISGFFGGLSGHQGAFRSMFLLKAGLDKEAFIATGIMIAVMVDVSRMSIYGMSISGEALQEWPLVASACLAAFTGAYLGRKLLTKVTMKTVRGIVSVLLVVVSVGLIAGVI